MIDDPETGEMDFRQEDGSLPILQSHMDLLDEREVLIREGKAEFIDWEVAKREILRRVSEVAG